jgi:drug/metabolite transporter (DMT)-like permease
MKFDNRHKAILATILAQSIWGFAGPFVKVALNTAPAISFLFLRCLFATIILFIIYEIKFAKTYAKIPWPDKRDLFLAGFTGVFLNTIFYFVGQQLTTVSDAWIITSAGTIFVVVYCYFFEKERLPKTTYLGVGIAFLGTLVIIGSPILHAGSGSLTGNVFMLASTIAGASSYMIIKRLIDHIDPFVIAYYSFLWTTVLMIPLFLWDFTKNPTWLGQISPAEIGILIFLVVASSIIAYNLSNWGLRYLSASISATIGYWSPIIAIGLSIAFLGEKPTVFFAIGSIITIFGLILTETRHKLRKQQNS